jgi:hypothetical protein
MEVAKHSLGAAKMARQEIQILWEVNPEEDQLSSPLSLSA